MLNGEGTLHRPPKKDFSQNGVYVSPLAGLKIIIRPTQGFATLTLGFYVACPLGRQAIRQSESITFTAAKLQKPGGRHIEAQGKPGRQARRSPGWDSIDLEPCKGGT